MSGHSKWHNIQRRKGKQDAVRGQLFTKLSRDVYLAAKEGGGNPDTNFRLKVAIERAKQSNLPADNITRTIAKATGSLEGVTYEEIQYEGYAPHGVAVLLDIVTDNRNRTAADVRHIFKKRGGNLAESGAVAWMFTRTGQISVERARVTDAEAFMLEVIEAGADDVEESDDVFLITTSVEAFRSVRSAIEAMGLEYEDAELTYVPSTTVEVQDEAADDVFGLIEALEAHDDVQTVYHNAVTPDDEEDA
ncbi:YebC/PmpR family DNA-binding transcriptional regulator [Alicyclobacillus fastidiosus]|uniref:Probable transcriptional regulatory protein KKP3000_000880 n=1 Tax=Alicyclobacillus fastidiosus TaxID=392011 RepID=A0ABV5AIN5_9BACL|nr:YebC/PmpR family DNA-binding transcriptional regulator [Alicyclobacillus fastidiosus]WEH11198.1 YebC/PmpR family DNA-binding transcriptional regulator [Alicyclobacillus fastidiosus]